jgi:pimeloyl-ACP methyl ester carboxylesterase
MTTNSDLAERQEQSLSDTCEVVNPDALDVNAHTTNAAATTRRRFLAAAGGIAASLPFVNVRETLAREVADADRVPELEQEPLVIARQGSFAAGGIVITNPGTFDPINPTAAGQTFSGDHLYAQFQVPLHARDLPLVMWHGGGQMGKTWESTPDGREGYQSIFLRRGFAVYIIDQPRRGRASRSTLPVTITPDAGEQAAFVSFRLGIWPNFYSNTQFPQDPAALDQFFRQQVPELDDDHAPKDRATITDGVAALFAKIGPAVLITHSASGGLGWLTAMKSPHVKAIVAYEPSVFFFPQGEVPPPIVTPKGTTPGESVSAADFEKLTKIPIQIVYGDHIPTSPSPYPGVDSFFRVRTMATLMVAAINAHGGNASILNLPSVGIFGNTHFSFSDLNNLQIADLLSRYLNRHGLDRP